MGPLFWLLHPWRVIELYKVAWWEVEYWQVSDLKQMVFIPVQILIVMKHYTIHNEATQGSRFKYNSISPTQAHVESQCADNPLCIALRESDVEMRRVKSKIPTVWADGGLRYL